MAEETRFDCSMLNGLYKSVAPVSAPPSSPVPFFLIPPHQTRLKMKANRKKTPEILQFISSDKTWTRALVLYKVSSVHPHLVLYSVHCGICDKREEDRVVVLWLFVCTEL